MSVGLIVSSPPQKYRIESFLGSGATANVYKAVASDPESGEMIAVKIPHSRLSPTLAVRFWSEEDTVQQLLRGFNPPLYFPRTWAGRIDETGIPVLCIELVAGKPLGDLIDYRRPVAENEKIALGVAVQYADMLAQMHRCEISCPDRKPGDIYWDDESRQMTVLDWNVVDKGEKFFEKEIEKAKTIGTDIYIFGRLWYEFLIGILPSPPSERLYRPLHISDRWEDISLGMRRILEMALAPEGGYKTASDLYRDLRDHNRDSDSDPTRIAQEALDKAKDSFKKISGTGGDYQLLNLYGDTFEAMRLADLTRRKTGDSRLWDECVKLAEGWMQPVQQATIAFKAVEYSKTLEYVTEAKRLAASIFELHKYDLAVERLGIAAEAGRLAIIQDSKKLDQFKNHIGHVLDALGPDAPDINKAQKAWLRLGDGVRRDGWATDSKCHQKLQAIGQEIDFHLAWQAYQTSKNVEDIEKAIAALQIDNYQSGHPYGARLLKRLNQTPQKLMEERDRLGSDGASQERIDQFRAAVIAKIQAGHYWDASQYFQEDWERLGGFPISPAERESLLCLGKTAQLLQRIEQAKERQDWDALLARSKGLFDLVREQGHPTKIAEIDSTISHTLRDAYQATIDDLLTFYAVNNTGNSWGAVNDPQKAKYAVWLYQLLKIWKEDNWLRLILGRSAQNSSK